MRRLSCAAALTIAAWQCGQALGQQVSDAVPQRPTADSSIASGEDVRRSAEPAPAVTRMAFTTGSIIRLLEEKPEVTLEVKQFMAEHLEQQGFQIRDDEITDEQVYDAIAKDARLRDVLTSWLLARGYVSEATPAEMEMEPLPGLRSAEPTAPGLTDLQGQTSRSLTGGQESLQSQYALESRETLQGQNALAAQDDLMSAEWLTPEQRESLTTLDSQRNGDPYLQGFSNFPSSSSSRPAQPASNITAPGTAADRGLQQRLKSPTDEAMLENKPELLHVPAPYNLLSLHDLYTQVPVQEQKLKRFGSDVFLNRGNVSAATSTSRALPATREFPIDAPIGPDYVLGPGDGLSITIWGSGSQTIPRVIDRGGMVTLPEAGPIMVAGMTLEHAEATIQAVLSGQFRNAHVSVTVARLRTVRVYVVGDVQRPGAYDISSLATPLAALYAAGGPTSTGSLRILRHLRAGKVVGEIDLYAFFLHGVIASTDRLEPGDTVLAPPVGRQVAVSGDVKRPAIYELKDESNLEQVLEDAGGLSVEASLSHIEVERVDAKGSREIVKVSVPSGGDRGETEKALGAFAIMDGDHVLVQPIVPWSDRVVYAQGHVVRPGRYPYHDNMLLTEVLHSYQDLLPEPSDHGEIVRLAPPEMRPVTIAFSLREELAGNDPIPLQPFDTIRILGRYAADAPRVTIRGEVLRPGVYALSEGMTAADLVRAAGGFKRSALLDEADLASYQIRDGRELVSRRTTVKIGAAVEQSDKEADVALKPGDVLTIHQVSGWNDIGASVKIEGEAVYPGTYGLQEGERLSSVLLRAGGFRATAYPRGAVLLRTEVKALEERSRAELIRQIETASASARIGPNLQGQDQSSTLQVMMQEQNQLLERLRTQPSTGRLVINIGADIHAWENTAADIEMRAGDVLIIPKRPAFVLVSGQVYNASAITFVPGKTADWYLKRAGGATDIADRKEIFVIRANGSVVGRRSSGFLEGDVLSTKLDPGDVVVVPQRIIGGSAFWRNALVTAQFASSITVAAVLAAGL